MTIGFGRWRLMVLRAGPPARRARRFFPMAEQASDGELAVLVGLSAALHHRRWWEVDAILYGPALSRPIPHT